MKKKRTSFLTILIVFVMVLVAAAIVVTKLEPYQAPPAVTTASAPSGVVGTAAPAGTTAAETAPPETSRGPRRIAAQRPGTGRIHRERGHYGRPADAPAHL